MTPEQAAGVAPSVSIAIFAWNEEHALRPTLQSLFEQSLFAQLHRLNECCEVVCVANGCTDRTAEVAAELFGELLAQHPHRQAIRARVANIPERGKVNAWNRFVHQVSTPGARVLFMMDADILIHRPETMENMLATLTTDHEASVSVDVPCKHIAHKSRRSVGDRLSLAASRMTLGADGQLCGQLYCIRAEVARRIYLPVDLSACEDGLIKVFVCTDFLSHSAWAKRIRVAPSAEHTFEAYTTPRSILKNQKRQIMGQTFVHVLVDKYLAARSPSECQDVGQFLRAKDASEPGWLKRLIAEHLQNTRWPWRLYPDLAANRMRRLSKLPLLQRLACLPAAVAGSCATLVASVLAYRALKSGCTDYWPKAQRSGLQRDTGQLSDANGLKPMSLSQWGGTK